MASVLAGKERTWAAPSLSHLFGSQEPEKPPSWSFPQSCPSRSGAEPQGTGGRAELTACPAAMLAETAARLSAASWLLPHRLLALRALLLSAAP